MQRFAGIFGTALMLALAGPATAEDVVIRIEARQGTASAQQAAEDWARQFPDVVTFPLAQGWIGIALGPMPRETAAPRLQELKSQGRIPADSFLSPAEGRRLEPLPSTTTDTESARPDTATESEAETGTLPAASPSLFTPGALTVHEPPSTLPDGDEDMGAEEEAGVSADPDAAPAAPEEFHIRIESTADRARAEEALERHRTLLPEAALWTLPNGRFAVGFGPMARDAGEAWLAAFKRAGALPRDAFLTPAAEMGEISIEGSDPRIGTLAPPDASMPPLEDIQRALRWAGHYDGAIDGKDGPMTRAAIAREIVRERASPDEATAMNALIQRRAAWRDSIGLTGLQDDHTGLELPAPMDRLSFDRTERALSIYGPRDGSGAALILFSQPGGQQEMLDLAGLVTALGWVPSPERRITRGNALLSGRNDTHIGHAEAQVTDGRVQGFVLIWPATDEENQIRLAAEISDGIHRFGPAGNDAEFASSSDPIDARSAEETAPEPTEAQAGPDTSR